MTSDPTRDDDGQDMTDRRFGLYVEPGERPTAGDEPEVLALDNREGARRTRMLPVIVSLLALGAFLGIVWYAYTWGGDDPADHQIPVIKAEQGPEKVRPEDPGGLEVPYQDKLVLNELESDPAEPQVENLLPLPEAPILVAPREPEAPLEAAPASPLNLAEDGMQKSGEATAESGEGEATGVREGEALPASPTERDVGAAAALPTPPQVKDQSKAAKAAQQARLEAPGSSAPPAVPAVSNTSGLYSVQLASFSSKGAATREWTRLQRSFPDLLGGRNLSTEAAEVRDRGTFYRVQTGPFANRATAEQFCTLLKARQQDCLVVSR